MTGPLLLSAFGFGMPRPAASPMRLRAAALLLASAIGFLAAPCVSRDAVAEGAGPLSGFLVPDPGLSPGDVVRIQLEALGSNDATDAGIAVAYRFASPANRKSTGPFPRFAAMIRNGPYAPMLDYRSAAYGPVEVVGDRARQRVALAGPFGSVTYRFYLSRQTRTPFENCWMTDAVIVEESPPKVTCAQRFGERDCRGQLSVAAITRGPESPGGQIRSDVLWPVPER